MAKKTHTRRILPVRVESDYLIDSNKKKCTKLLSKKELTTEDLIDIHISLHIVLEVGLNNLFRELSLWQMKKSIDRLKIIDNLDQINFIDKTTLFIYNSSFNFESNLEKAGKYHSTIAKLKNFAEMRNRLLHGHSISEIHIFGGADFSKSTKQSKTKKLLNIETLKKQIKLFKDICEGVRFYIDHLDNLEHPEYDKKYLKEKIDDSFLSV